MVTIDSSYLLCYPNYVAQNISIKLAGLLSDRVQLWIQKGFETVNTRNTQLRKQSILSNSKIDVFNKLVSFSDS